MSKKERRSTFNLEGRCLGLAFKDGKPKRLQLLTANGEHTVKLAKAVRTSIGADVAPGAWIQVWGERKAGHKPEEATFKAFKVELTAPGKPEERATSAESRPTTSAKILVCQKSDCMKRGGKAVCHALEAALSDRQLTDVKIQGTGCMKHCKAGPNIVFMPDKTRYSRVSAQDVDALVDEHFPHTPIQATSNQTNSGAV